MLMKPARVTKPGDVLKEELEARGWDSGELMRQAVRCGYLLSNTTIDSIIDGHEEITQTAADCFSKVLGTTADFWLNMERDYREAMKGEGI